MSHTPEKSPVTASEAAPGRAWLRAVRHSVALQFVLLLATVAALSSLIVPTGYWLGGQAGLIAAAASGVICLLGAASALGVNAALARVDALAAMLVSMALRTGVPLALGFVLHFRWAALADAGVMFYLVAFYLPTLLVETLLSLPEAAPAAGRGASAGSIARPRRGTEAC